jgi:hypothetical protein
MTQYLCHQPDPDAESEYMCNQGLNHPGDHAVSDGEGGKTLAQWPNTATGFAIPIPTQIGEVHGFVVSALRLPADAISHESWIAVVSYATDGSMTFSTHLVNYHAEDARYYASNGHYEIPTLAEATADAVERWNRGI